MAKQLRGRVFVPSVVLVGLPQEATPRSSPACPTANVSADGRGDSRATTILGPLTLPWQPPARAVSFLFGNRYALLALLACFYVVFIVSMHAKYYAPFGRGGTEAYDIYVNAYNVLYDHSISYAFLPGLLEQDVDHPHARPQQVYLHGPFSQRFVGAAVLLLGFANVHTFFLILCLGFCAAFLAIVGKLAAHNGHLGNSRDYAITGALLFLYTLCDQNGLVMFLNPNRLPQFAFFYLTLLLCRRLLIARLDWKTHSYIAASFFIIWQCELVFALFCSLAFTFAVCLAARIRKSWKAVLAAACGTCASVSLFIFQLLSYRGLSVFSDIISTMGERNGVLYGGRPKYFEGVVPSHTLLAVFWEGHTPLQYDIPVDFADFVRHFFFIVTGRYGVVSVVLWIALLMALALVADERLFSGRLRGFLDIRKRSDAISLMGRFYLASVFAFFACAVPFRGFLAYMYIVMNYPMLCMVFTCGLTFISLVAIATFRRCWGRQRRRYVAPVAVVAAIALVLFYDSANRAENDVRAALPDGADALRALAGLHLSHDRIGINMRTYVEPEGRYPAGLLLGLTGRPGLYVPATQAVTTDRKYPELRYYLCSDQPDCWAVLPELQRRGATLIANGASYFLVQLAPRP